ncbi:MAG: CDP-glycerol:poly(glycerophosphate) glycerophosphotransferase (EC [uncultured Sulfurovum sp.]|uniref:CDP-glycerol:poly(Glycerophosphate) glycerophosphotransferase (EC) n=1 Tax=uncultured Sulfurovum sp. TaxID=269237 RepID=A0A6S6TK59_9BACT|nr:MAG: CDP-glycerol:poly(glycerophosphate) glycerophosphotransferase (EC [uncultured Sulfurovum sp.]
MKRKVEIVQTDTRIKFIFSFHPTFKPKKLILINDDLCLGVDIERKGTNYSCELSYAWIIQNFSEKINFKIFGEHSIKDPERVLLNLQSTKWTESSKKLSLSDYMYQEAQFSLISTVDKTIYLGKFKEIKFSNFKLITYNNIMLYPYLTLGNNLSMLIQESPKDTSSDVKVNIKVNLKDLVFRRGSIVLDGSIQSYSNKAKNIVVILKGRTTRKVFTTPLKRREVHRKNGNFNYFFKHEIFFSNFDLEEDSYDLFFGFEIDGFRELVERRVGNPGYFVRQKAKVFQIVHDDITFINPYFTFKGKNLSFTVEKVQKNIYEKYQEIKRKKKKESVWLVGEQPFKAQDTGYNFFKYMRENFPEKEVYYVIDFDSVEYQNVKNLGNLVNYRSEEHFEILSKTTHLIASHNPYYLMPLTHPEFQNEINAKKIFIQHGVFGTKNIANIYGKSIDNFNVDMFVVSSEKEKRFATDDLGYRDDEVKITGLSRFDTLFANEVAVKRQILIIPTWRDWLGNYDSFISSDYYKRYKSLLESKILNDLAEENNLEIAFCLHPNMQKFVDAFDLEGIRVISQGEVNVQLLLKESMLMITDYSSVAFDFSFLEKPVIYYQFDTERFLGKYPSHLDINEDLPGDIVRNEDDALDRLALYIENDCKMSLENLEKSRQFLKYKDTNNNKRIKEEIERFETQYHPLDNALKNERGQLVFKKFRKGKYYFPLMKKLYTLMKFLPMNKNRVVFESGLGLQYADGPRYIFEELLKKYPDNEYIWVQNGKIYNLPDNCEVVERLSFKYYYYLATSKYWVNNQNFPFYITRRKAGVYLQTWHGTPLKKMLFDLENIHGRDDGYIERVEQAKNQWSYLLSQSSYATEKFRTAFKYEGEILEEGYPRNDILINEADNKDYISRIKRNLNIPKDKKVILYAPTFRDNAEKKGNKFNMELAIDFDKFMKEVSDEYILLLRVHVLVKQNITLTDSQKSRIIDVSSFSDIQELYLVSDMLITDYSSVFFDYANLNKPIIFYAYDLETYRDELRGFYLDYDQELPGPIVKTEEALYSTIENIEESNKVYVNRYIDFRAKYLPKDDGEATKRVVSELFKF